jgi:hypothetical protein
MGRRAKRRIFQNQKRITNEIEETKEMKFFLACLETSQEDPGLKIMKQAKDCINEIYSEHINDLEVRKKKRLESKNPTEYFQPYNLVVNTAYQSKIKSFIQEMITSEHIQSFKSAFLDSTDIFVDHLRSHVKEFIGKKALLQAIILYESFHTLQNSITQIGAITEDLIPRKDFELMLKEKFKTRVMNNYAELIENVLKKEQSDYIEDLLRMEKSLQNHDCQELFLEYSPGSQDLDSEDDFNSDALHNLPIDELVKIINESPKRRTEKMKKIEEFKETIEKSSVEKRQDFEFSWTGEMAGMDPCEEIICKNEDFLDNQRAVNRESKQVKEKKTKSRLNTAENSFSPFREEVDKEVESFRQRLELEKPFPVKSRPLISDEFLANLRKKLGLSG